MTDKKPMSEHTPTPWSWHWEDKSVMVFCGPGELEDHVLWSQVCSSCQNTDSRCTAPSDANANHIVHCVNVHDDLLAALEEAERCMSLIDAMVQQDGKSCTLDRWGSVLTYVKHQAEEGAAEARAALAKVRGTDET